MAKKIPLDFTAISAWQAATLFACYQKDKKLTTVDALALKNHILTKTTSSGGFPKKWKDLRDAVIAKDYEMIKYIAVDPRNGGVPWPKQLTKFGMKCHNRVKIVVK